MDFSATISVNTTPRLPWKSADALDIASQKAKVAIQNLCKKNFEEMCATYYFFVVMPQQFPTNCHRWPESDMILPGSQFNGSGTVNQAQALAVCEKLNAHKPLGISFNSARVHPMINGGTCTVMALEFAKIYFDLREKTKSKDYPYEMLDLISRQNQLRESNATMRTLQAAFNAIEIIAYHSVKDHSRNKVQALLNFYSFEIKDVSTEWDIEILSFHKFFYDAYCEIDFLNEFFFLPDGVYFVRNIAPENNHKLERQGHSTIYIRERGLNLYYDANIGVLNLFELNNHPATLLDFLNKNTNEFGIRRFRFYRIEPKQVEYDLNYYLKQLSVRSN